jgi:hypothetical protein
MAQVICAHRPQYSPRVSDYRNDTLRRKQPPCLRPLNIRGNLSSEPMCNTPADLIIGTVDQDLRECCHAMLFPFVG